MKQEESWRSRNLPEIVAAELERLGYDEVDHEIREARKSIYMARSGLHLAWGRAVLVDHGARTYLQQAHDSTTEAMRQLRAFARELKKQHKEA